MTATLKTKKRAVENKGRRGDKKIAHLTPGEIVIPRAFAEDDDFRAVINLFFKENNVDLREFIVGDSKNKTNPETGYLEFGWNPIKSVKKAFKKAWKNISHIPGKVGKEAKRLIPSPPSLPDIVAPDPPPSPALADETTAARSQVKARRRGRSTQILAGQLNRQVLNFGKTRVGE